MKKIPMKELVEKARSVNAVLLGVGPMSVNVLEACFEISKEKNTPLMFIASRNQIDLHELGGGYVNGWDQYEFVDAIKQMAEKNDFHNYYICRDHGGPWQRDKERNDHLPLEEAMGIAKKSFAADIAAGFDLIMVDPTKDPFVAGKVVDINFVLDKTVELIEFCEDERKKQNKDTIYYEVGTEETNGGLTDVEVYNQFIIELNRRLDEKQLPRPIFAVGQTGTLVKSTTQAGYFDVDSALKLVRMADANGTHLKEHNADYLDYDSLLAHVTAGVSAINVAPQFGTEETRAYLELCELEEKFLKEGTLEHSSNLKKVLTAEAIKTRRWCKWVAQEEAALGYDEIIKNPALAQEILEIAGHYTFNNDDVRRAINVLFDNASQCSIDGKKFVIDRIKDSINVYIESLNLGDLLARI